MTSHEATHAALAAATLALCLPLLLGSSDCEPAAPEVCDRLDNDLDGVVDEGLPIERLLVVHVEGNLDSRTEYEASRACPPGAIWAYYPYYTMRDLEACSDFSIQLEALDAGGAPHEVRVFLLREQTNNTWEASVVVAAADVVSHSSAPSDDEAAYLIDSTTLTFGVDGELEVATPGGFGGVGEPGRVVFGNGQSLRLRQDWSQVTQWGQWSALIGLSLEEVADDQVCLPAEAEVCDGQDNDRDGYVDEGFDSDRDLVADCMDAEACDWIDNDGDGRIDEGMNTEPGLTLSPYVNLDSRSQPSAAPGIDSDAFAADSLDYEALTQRAALVSQLYIEDSAGQAHPLSIFWQRASEPRTWVVAVVVPASHVHGDYVSGLAPDDPFYLLGCEIVFNSDGRVSSDQVYAAGGTVGPGALTLPSGERLWLALEHRQESSYAEPSRVNGTLLESIHACL